MPFTLEPLTDAAKAEIDFQALGIGADRLPPESKWVVDRDAHLFLIAASVDGQARLLFSYQSRPIWLEIDASSSDLVTWQAWNTLTAEDAVAISALISVAYGMLLADVMPGKRPPATVTARRPAAASMIKEPNAFASEWHAVRARLRSVSAAFDKFFPEDERQRHLLKALFWFLILVLIMVLNRCA